MVEFKVKLPTVPLNPAGFPDNGKAFTFIFVAGAIISFETFV